MFRNGYGKKIDEFIQNILNKTAKNKILILVLTGVLLMVIAIPSGKKQTEIKSGTTSSSENQSDSTEINDYEKYLEERLEKILSSVDGVGKTKVFLTFKNSSEKVLATDSSKSSKNTDESDSSGGVRNTDELSENSSHIYYDTADGKNPYIIMENMPEVEGIIVVCEGGDNKILVSDITNAVESILGVPVHKIKVMKMYQNAG